MSSDIRAVEADKGRRWLTRLPRIGRREAGNFTVLVAAQVIVALVGLVSTRYLAPSDKGLFTGGYLWALVGQTIVGLSLPNALLYFGTADGRSRPSRSVAYLLLATSLLCGVGLALTAGSHAGASIAFKLLLVPMPAAMLSFEVATYSALAERGPFHVSRLAQAGLFGVLAVPTLLVFHSATLLMGCLLASYLVAVAIVLSHRTQTLLSTRRLILADLLRWSLRAHGGLTLSLLATRLDILFVTLFLGSFAAGQYVAAAALPNLFAFSGTALGLSIARRVTAHSGRRAPGFAWVWGLMLLAACVTLTAVIVAAREQLITSMFGSPYLPAASIAVPLAIALPMWSLSGYQSQLLSAIGHPAHQTIGQGLAAVVLGAGSAYGVSHDSLLFVGWSNVAAYACSAIWQTIALAWVRRT